MIFHPQLYICIRQTENEYITYFYSFFLHTCLDRRLFEILFEIIPLTIFVMWCIWDKKIIKKIKSWLKIIIVMHAISSIIDILYTNWFNYLKNVYSLVIRVYKHNQPSVYKDRILS